MSTSTDAPAWVDLLVRALGHTGPTAPAAFLRTAADLAEELRRTRDALDKARADADALEIERDDAIAEIGRCRTIEEEARLVLPLLEGASDPVLQEAAEPLREALALPGRWP